MSTAWVQILHFYQPPGQTHEILRKVAVESYQPVVRVLLEQPTARVAVNMNAVLSEMLVEHGYGDVIDGLKTLQARGQIEFLGSGRYHPIFPLIAARDRNRAIAENAASNRAAFGRGYAPRGFFPPELAYSQDILPAIRATGHDWVLLSGVANPGEWQTTRVPKARSNGSQIAVLFRDDVRSNRISFREVTAATWIADLERVGNDGQDHYVVTGMDGETFGHHIRGWEREFLAAAYAGAEASPTVRMMLPSEVLDAFPAGDFVEPFASSWSTSRDDIASGDPFPLWKSPGNRLHSLQWDLVEHGETLTAMASRHARDGDSAKDAALASELLQPALHSCQFWWASKRPWWDVTMIRRGLRMQEDVILHAGRSIHGGAAPQEVRREATWRLAAANEIRHEIERTLMNLA
ncbi:MAG: hypothetical protein KC495_14290 [Dehalococcoidia bacterium]|nr:hypothetical protein [Dehalococcoidia bacterium]MCB9484678.1 hypothetical protein [Thermoflexaceae bacterium]